MKNDKMIITVIETESGGVDLTIAYDPALTLGLSTPLYNTRLAVLCAIEAMCNANDVEAGK